MNDNRTEAWRKIIPPLSSLPAAPQRIILHWTGGGPTANAVDLKHYHYVVQHDGSVVKGNHDVSANMRKLTSGSQYAAHTGGMNSFSVGVSFAGMLNWRPGGTTTAPLKEQQVLSGLAFVALLCQSFKLDPRNAKHLFTHAEAWTLHGVKGTVNHQKTDITFLPHNPSLGPKDVGPWIRTQVAKLAVSL